MTNSLKTTDDSLQGAALVALLNEAKLKDEWEVSDFAKEHSLSYEIVQEEISDYSEGTVSTDYVSKFEDTYVSFYSASNSWDDGFGDYTDSLQFALVKPVEKTITVYEAA